MYSASFISVGKSVTQLPAGVSVLSGLHQGAAIPWVPRLILSAEALPETALQPTSLPTQTLQNSNQTIADEPLRSRPPEQCRLPARGKATVLTA